MKRMISAILAVLILIASFTSYVSAAYENSGSCGSDLTWYYDGDTKTLVIEGSGKMTNWFSNRQVPWKHLRKEATALSLPQGLTSVGDYAFFGFENIPELSIPSTVKTIGNGAFSVWKSLKTVTIPEGVTTLYGWVFASCTALEEVRFPQSLTLIDYECFLNCPSLMDVTVPQNTTLERYVFGFLASHAINYDMIIRGVPGSSAQSYANTYFLNFVSVYATKEASVGMYGIFRGIETEEYTIAEMDYNGDGIISTKDSLVYKMTLAD